MSADTFTWPPAALSHELHFGNRLLRCYAKRPASLPHMLAQAHAQNPQASALVDGARRWTWADLHSTSAGLAAGLQRLGVRPGHRVALLAGNSAEFVLTTHAVLRIGAVLVPISIREAAPGVTYALNQCGASAVIADAALTHLVPDIRDDGQSLVRICISASALPALARPAVKSGWLAYSELHASSDVIDATPDEEDTAVILYTSGTTGQPKGAVLTHLNLLHSVLHYGHVLGLQPTDRALLAVPASHVTGLVAIVLAMASVGGTVVVQRDFKAAACLGLLASESISYTLMVPAMYALCLLEKEWPTTDLSALRMAGFGGAPMPDATIAGLRQQSKGIRLFNAYGATETASPATLTPLGCDQLDAVGMALPCADIRIMSDEGQELLNGQCGEVWIAGPMVVPRYWNNPKATLDSFTDGYWKSGDIGARDATGMLHLYDRKKDLINRGGYKVFSVEVENCLLSHPGVREAAVVGVPCLVLGERTHAFVYAPDPVDTADLQTQLKALCRRQIADYKTPDFWTIETDPLPRNANGKVMKLRLRERACAKKT